MEWLSDEGRRDLEGELFAVFYKYLPSNSSIIELSRIVDGSVKVFKDERQRYENAKKEYDNPGYQDWLESLDEVYNKPGEYIITNDNLKELTQIMDRMQPKEGE